MQADIWSFAVCLVEMLEKKPPNKESKIMALYTVGTEGLKNTVKYHTYSEDCRDFIRNCLEFDQNNRATVHTLLKVL